MLREALEAALNDGTLEAWSFFVVLGCVCVCVLKILESRDFCRGPFFREDMGPLALQLFLSQMMFSMFSACL